MPERLFNAQKFRAAIQASGLKQSEVGKPPVSLGESVISRYCSGAVTPPAEKLPVLAERVGLPLDALAPRRGLPDLKDLRCDAGIQQKDTPQYTRTKSAMPVRAAENGLRRLKEELEAPLAEAYGVSVEELKAAQERSFGNIVPAVRKPATLRPVIPGTPQTVAEKITYLLEKTYASHERPTDGELAGHGNMKTGRPILDEDLVRGLRTGEETTEDEAVLAAVAAALDAPLVFFTSDSPDEAARIVAGIRTVQNGVMAARHGDGPLPAEWLSFIEDSIREITGGKSPDGTPGQD